MPCRDGGPSLANSLAFPSQAQSTAAGLGGIVSSADLRETKERLDHVTSLLCELCSELEAHNQEDYISDNPELEDWWEDHQEQDRKAREQRQKEYDVALENAQRARAQQKNYIARLLDENMDDEDKMYFKSKLHRLQVEIDEAFENFPDLIPVLGKNLIDYKGQAKLPGGASPVE